MRISFFLKTLFVFILSIIPLASTGYALGGVVYISPAPNSQRVAPQTSIVLRLAGGPPTVEPLNSLLTVHGKLGGPMDGVTSIASDEQTIIFRPRQPFIAGDIISVTVNSESSAAPFSFHFTISSQTKPALDMMTPDEARESEPRGRSLRKETAGPRIMPNGVSVPGDFPFINVFTNNGPADGYIFLNNWRDVHPFDIIFDNDGSPIWYMRTPDGDRRRDFTVQKNGILTMLVRQGYDFGTGFIGLDSTYTEIDQFHPVDGYSGDEHELQVLADGHYLLIGRRVDTVDMSKYVAGGKTNARVRETCIQEFTPQHEKIFEWRAWDHFDIRDVQLENLQGDFIRFPHMNAIDIDDDDNILLSSRHLSEVTKINRQTGDIIWRLGGAHSDFTFVNDPLDGFRNQHDVRALGNGHYTVFDNGNLHSPNVSRAVEYVLDLNAMTATLVWEFRNPRGTSYSFYMGNNQRLPNGNRFINWAVGDRPKATEVRPDGTVVYEMNFVDQYHCYRAFRFPWKGVAAKPTLIVEPSINDVALIFNKFGDDNVDYYKIYAAAHHNASTLLDTSKKTLKSFANLENNKKVYFRVTAVDKDGHESAYSNEESVVTNFVKPGSELANNGDFSGGTDGWTFELSGSGSAEWSIRNDGAAWIKISKGGNNVYDVQLRQNGMPLIQGESYTFEFDAWASGNRSMEAKVSQDNGPWINYSKIGLSALSRTKKHFSYTFKMEDPSDLNARIVFNMGASGVDVFLDNVSLKQVVASHINKAEITAPHKFELLGNYPNPFNAATTIVFSTDFESHIKLHIYDLLGRRVNSMDFGMFHPGQHHFAIDGQTLASGVYFYRLDAVETNGRAHSSKIKKLTLLK